MVRAVLKIAISVIICLSMRLKIGICIGDSAIGGSWEVGRYKARSLRSFMSSLSGFLLHAAASLP